MTRIVALSDTHGKHEQVEVPSGDIVIHAGDITSMGTLAELKTFLLWFDSLPHDWKIFIAGNHDFGMRHHANTLMDEFSNINYLENTGLIIKHIWNDSQVSIWGSPYTMEFNDWAYMTNENGMADICEKMPQNLDLLITHGPPYGVLDRTIEGEHCGSKALLRAVEEKKPKRHIFGHIHEAHGEELIGPTYFMNASILSRQYGVTNECTVFDI